MSTANRNEFELSDRHFAWVCSQVKERTGINLTPGKRNLVYNRLASRLRTLGLKDFNDYLALVERADSDEVENFVNAITTNVTSFFREDHHFEFLTGTAIPEVKAKNAAARRMRIWSAGCSMGMEPYSIAMVLRECFAENPPWDTRILATDLDTNVLATAAAGVYDEQAATGISDERLRRFVLKGKGNQEGKIRMRPELSSLITFRHLNLMEDWPITGPFDVIFCRNVVIYFDKETQAKLWTRYGALLRPNGYLIVGHSETVSNTEIFSSVGRTIYQKKGAE